MSRKQIFSYQNTQESRGRQTIDRQNWPICFWRKVCYEINKVDTFPEGFKDNQKDRISKLDDLQNLLIRLTFKASAEKVWLLYEFPSSLNLGDKPNNVQTWQRCSSLYLVRREDQFWVNSKRNWLDIVEAAKYKAHQILVSC